jgi:GTP-binding protein
MFIDEIKLKVIAWRGWDWIVSWRREKYIPKWGPRGWDGWHGWNVFLRTNENINTLSDYRHIKHISAEEWVRWDTQDMHGRNGEDLVLEVPVWTIVTDANTGELIVDLSENNMKYLIARWGRWGFWNTHFTSSTRQAPAFAELGDIWEEKDLKLELKLVADIWIIGIPSAGKSSLISVITNVKPKIGDYPFTTLTPNLWVMEHKGKNLVIEDVPGLIPGASEGKWLGVDFLKHIERTRVLLHLVDLYTLDQVFQHYTDIRYELEAFSPELAEKEEVIVFSKADLLDEEMRDYIVSEFNKRFPNKKTLVISSASFYWIEELKDFLVDNYLVEKEVLTEEELKKNEIKLYDLREYEDPKSFEIEYLGDLKFRLIWKRLEQIVRMTNFENFEAIMRVYDVLDRVWAIKKIESMLKKVQEEEGYNTDFYFVGNEDQEFSPKIIIGEKEISLDKLKFDL